MSKKADPQRNDADTGAEGSLARASKAMKVLADRAVEVLAKEEAALDRDDVSELREEVATLRDEAMHAQEESTRAIAARSADIEAQLQEATELIDAATENARAVTETAELASEQISHMAGHDFLTGLPNRSLLGERLTQAIATAQDRGGKVALMSLDLDHFKHVNDSLGHAVGDRLLQSAAARLQTCLRDLGTISRQGGDEFAVLLPEVESAQAVVLIAEKLIETMTQPHLIDGHRLHISPSIGISLYPDDGGDAETMLRNADTAMNHAKRTGRNNYQRFTREMNVRAVARQSVEEALRHALEHDELVLHYQPTVNFESGRITGAEALLRWRNHGRLLCPSQFIGIAEDSGLILPIGQWVLGEACRQTQAWLQAGLDIGQIAVNVSAVEFRGRNFLVGVDAVLGDTGLDPARLELEMTESVIMQDTEPTMVLLRELKHLGVQLAIDDFGTGYSSLSYLQRFPIDTLKIDQSFVRDIAGEAGAAIVTAIISMGTSLNYRIVAEGIESRQQFAFLKSRNCTEGQGHFFSRPVPADEFAAQLGAARH